MIKDKEQLLAEKEKIQVQIEQAKHNKQRIENRIGYFESGDRRKRAHRLITRGAAIESISPELKALTEVEFYSLMEQVMSLPEAQTAIRAAVAKYAEAE